MGAKILLQLSSLSFLHNATGRLDLSNNDMIVHNSAVATLAGELKSGFNMGGSYWNGGAGIISTAAAADPTYQTTLAYEAGGVTFDNVSTSSSDVLVKYTDYGDADLNGTVNGADYQQIDKGFGMHLSGWSNGDFNYDGVIDGSDFSLIDNSFNQFMASGANPLAIVSADAISRAVPEPGMMGLLGVGASGLLLRRRRGLI